MRSKYSPRSWKSFQVLPSRHYSRSHSPPWRPVSAVDEYDSISSYEILVLTSALYQMGGKSYTTYQSSAADLLRPYLDRTAPDQLRKLRANRAPNPVGAQGRDRDEYV